MTWTWFDLAWPYLGLGAAVVILAVLGARLVAARDSWRRPAWLAWLGLAAYLVHQFEEYGIDAAGRAHAFPADLCGALGFDAGACPIPAGFYLAVNLGSVILGGVVGALVAPHRPAVGLSIYGAVAVNAVIHITQSALRDVYGAGLVTAIVVFLPLAVLVARVAFVRGRLGILPMLLILLGGVLQHVVLLGSVAAFTAGALAEPVLIAVQVANAFTTLAILAGWQLVHDRRLRGSAGDEPSRAN